MNFRVILRSVLACSLLLAAMLSLSACNTVKGAGKDVERAGDKVQGAAEGAQHN